MRVGDFGVELVPVGDGALREMESGHVLARPGTVYGIRLRNFGPLRAVADVRLDDKSITARGLVIDAYSTVTLERPVHASETGRFTVIAEGNEAVFGADGGRDNPALGEIVASFRRELPQHDARAPRPAAIPLPPPSTFPGSGGGWGDDFPPAVPPLRPRPMAPPGWTPPSASAEGARAPRTPASINARAASGGAGSARVESAAPDVMSPPAQVPAPAGAPPLNGIERAAGTGLTGHSAQEFVSVPVGALESEATVIRMRLVIGTEAALSAPRPLRGSDELDASPMRPPARP